jgi:hypothetical protein
LAGGFGADLDRFGFAAVLVLAAAPRGFDLAVAFTTFRAAARGLVVRLGFAVRAWVTLFEVARDLTRFAATDLRLAGEGLRFGVGGLRLDADLARVEARLERDGARRVFFSAMKVPASGGL